MEIYDAFKMRRSIRNYKSDPIGDESLMRIAEAASIAPSACNRQPWKLIAVRDSRMRKAICEACPQRMLPTAPVILLAVGNASEAWKRPGDDHSIVEIDVGIMFQQTVLAATAEGLSTCWVCAYDVAKVNQAAGISAPWSVLALSPLGYAASPAAPIRRKPLNEVFEIR